MRTSVVGVEVGVSCCWLFVVCCPCWLPGRDTLLLEGVDGGRIGVGWRLVVGAIAGTSLKVLEEDFSVSIASMSNSKSKVNLGGPEMACALSLLKHVRRGRKGLRDTHWNADGIGSFSIISGWLIEQS